ncbi:uncharacterized protein K452DRAFT_287704 [Aplosporella prunicola CBS 121167]|uniref:Zn(2)-C6 fungal-type domain-containing protein n=1 Tax=Aplosporella prunicola CBS 121167 TaxID=1176127 RepID=A0A6A6BEK9_9PEZI|nr:uncharacterized protein K452DRAFT_287704 [Aplosporella prunicola CBS 121167]KAF2141745.1 hypothetical protein K452DRAFT_287704 [Aplosporella prunicola CBS 121167]
MPRPKKAGAPEPKRRSRNGCWPCKARKVKCGEEKPRCLNCQRAGEACDYSIRLNWNGRSKRSFDATPLLAAAPPAAPPASPPPPSQQQHRTKRLRLSPQDDPPLPPSTARQNFPVETPGAGMPGTDAPSPYSLPPMTPYSSFAGTPLTPGSSIASEEGSLRYQLPAESKRLSVNDLLIDGGQTANNNSYVRPLGRSSVDVVYGYDIGQPDLDTPKNDDGGAIAMFNPETSYGGSGDVANEPELDEEQQDQHRSRAFEADGYYAKPVPIKIPRAFEPLPARLLENPMNLLYFHHFLNHTARILVPHDCEQNPFRSVLPQLAVRDDDLLGLLLAFSASHRARLLCHKEPANRIAVWVQDVFPKLRRALTEQTISTANLTTAIMLASLEIISPNTFEVPVSWQNHLSVAREMIVARGGLRPRGEPDDNVAHFLSRWFAYLDVLGSLSGSKDDKPLAAAYLAFDRDDDDVIDCLLGFTWRFIVSLARLAELAQHCDTLRREAAATAAEGGGGSDGGADWVPPADVASAAEQLREELRLSCESASGEGCAHELRSSPSSTTTPSPSASTPTAIGCTSASPTDASEAHATNAAFHAAAQLHLLRRVLNRPPHDSEAQACVSAILAALARVRPGGSADACLLFPIFSAGCEALEPGQREEVLRRLRDLEAVGFAQVRGARVGLERVWRDGGGWVGGVMGWLGEGGGVFVG